MTKRTSINLELGLVEQAKHILGTSGTTETVHGALREVVRQARLRRLAGRSFDLSDDELRELRKPRAAQI
jgi:Arc/MetJ family transcription regulator